MDLGKLSRKELDELIERAERRKHELAQERVSRVRDQIHALLESEGLTFEEVFDGARRGRAPSRSKGIQVKPKYRNPDNAEQTWAGRGKRPRWFTDALSTGKSEDDLMIV